MAPPHESGAAFVTGGSGFIGGALIRRLVRDGRSVRALARSERAASEVAAAGAEPVEGDLDDVAAMRAAAADCATAFHAAAAIGEWGPWERFERVNVQGSRNVLDAARAAGVRRFVHVGSEAALLDGQPLVWVDESAPLRPDSRALYCRSKALAESAVIAACDGELETVVVRPRFVWGPGDRTILPTLVHAVRSRRFAWIGRGRHLTSTTHVENVVEGLAVAAERGRPGEAYFVTDGDPVEFRAFVTRLLATRGVEAPGMSMPAALARAAAAAAELAWRRLPLSGEPPITRLSVWVASLECTIDISKARDELGYTPRVSIDAGLDELAAAD